MAETKQVFSLQYPVGIPRLDIITPTTADFEQLLDPICRRLIVIHILGVFPRGFLVVTRKLQNVCPVRQEPSFEIVLCCMRVEARFRADPRAHLRFSICSIVEFSCPGVYVSQSDYRVSGSVTIA